MSDERPYNPDSSSSVTRHSFLPLSGILNVDKPAGPTSHDIVAHVRRLLNPKSKRRVPTEWAGTHAVGGGTRNPKSKVGHAGTLDPAATGVLLVLLGTATRLAEYLTDLPKEYDARIRFGLRTDSQDTTGAVLSRDDPSFLTEDQVRAALDPFRGEILQTPPMVSAVKVGGQRLYELARRGEEVERAARPVTIHKLSLEEFHPGPEAEGRLLVRCSSGTYVRTLCADLGEALGCGAAMATLRRTAIGPFLLSESVSLEGLERAVANERLNEHLLPPAAAVAHLPAVTVTAAEQARLLHGMAAAATFQPASSVAPTFQSASPAAPTGKSASPVRVLDESRNLIAIARQENDHLLPVKVLVAPVGTDR
jgi:tRNA pseudouridine55 synthase